MTQRDIWRKSRNKNNKTQKDKNKNIFNSTKNISIFSKELGQYLLEEGLENTVKWASKVFGVLGGLTTGITFDKFVNKESTQQAVTSQLFSAGTSIGAVALTATAISTLPVSLPTLATGAISIGTGIAVGNITNSYVDKNFNKFKSLFDIKKNKKNVKFKTRKTDITAAVEELNTKGSNSAEVQQIMTQNNAVQIIEHRPTSIVKNAA